MAHPKHAVPPATHATGLSSPSLSASPTPIAIIGLAGRFPGDAKNATKLWDMCCQGRSAWSPIPDARFNGEAYFHPETTKHGCMNARGAHFLEDDVGLFDAPFFGISPNEAKSMDPQQRLLLETTYEAFESAGIAIEKLAGHPTGVYVGASTVDYMKLVTRDIYDIPTYQVTGSGNTFLSNRISYVFDLKGPSMTLDTACSSSLSALHTACQSLRNNEISQAVVCGAHIMLDPDTMVSMSMLRMFAEDGLSHMYDDRGTGYGRGEGAVSLILKPLDDAVRDGDAIRAVIRNTGLNQDGKTAGITLPSCEAQTRLIRSVYDAIGLDPSDTAYVEAHGTGTAVGDPIEAEAIASVFAQDRSPDNPLFVGSVKTNIGHLEAASGLAAIVKAIFILESGIIPPNLHFEQPNRNIPLAEWNIKIPTSLTLWPESSVRRVSISNFGFGGTNAHIILDQHKPFRTPLDPLQNDTKHIHDDTNANSSLVQDIVAKQGSPPDGVYPQRYSSRRRLLTFSAGDTLSLKTQIAEIASNLAEREEMDNESFMDRLAYTLCHRRSRLDWRRAVIASNVPELVDLLSHPVSEPTRASTSLTCAFVFTGQGSQWYAMGRELSQYPAFLNSLLEAGSALKGFGAKWSLLDELDRDAQSSLVNSPHISQPATTAVQIALVALLLSWGVSPVAVVGHSSGEIAAAYAAGVLSLESCMQVAYHRGVLAGSLKDRRPDRPGAMLAIGATPEKVRPMIHRVGSNHIAIACINGPSLVTASGDADFISKLQSDAESEGLFNRRLKVDVAYHSPHMQDIAAEYLSAIKTVKTQAPSTVAFYSSVKGSHVDHADLDAQYWVDNMTSPVQFVDAVTSMYRKGCSPDVLIEIGPHSTLEAAIRDIIKNSHNLRPKVQYLPSLIRNRDAEISMLSLASSLHTLGINLNLATINGLDSSNYPKLLYDLPTYPWSYRKRHWHDTRLDKNHRMKTFPRNDLLGSLVDDFNDQEPRWRNILRASEIPWLADHNVQGSVIFPFTGYLTMAIEASFQYAAIQGKPVLPSTTYKLREIQVSRPMVFSANNPVEVSFVLRPREEGSRVKSKAWNDFCIFSWTNENGWIEHCHGLVSLYYHQEEVGSLNGRRQLDYEQAHHKELFETYQEMCKESIDPGEIYARFSRGGLNFGPVFRNITGARVAKDHSICTVSVPDTAQRMPSQSESAYSIHPGTFDACFQTLVCAADGGDLSKMDTHVPTFVEEIDLRHGLLPNTPGDKFLVFGSRQRPFGDLDTDIHASFTATCPGPDPMVMLEIRGFVGSPLPNDNTSDSQTGDRQLCYQTLFSPSINLMTPSQFNQYFCSMGGTTEVLRQLEAWNRAAFYYAQATFEGANGKRDDPYESHLQKLQRVLLDMLNLGKQGRLRFQTSEWLSCSESQKQEFLAQFASSDPCGRLLCKLGEQYPAILDGEVEPLSIMLQDDMLEKYYRNHEPLKVAYEANTQILREMAFQNPSMRVLEIGAGTGSHTASSLRGLGKSFAHYDFTDISTGFFQRAKEELQEYGEKIRYRKLNIAEDPITQGFEFESYDLILAGNVLHATANITTTMRNVRALLRRGGKIVISEVTSKLLSITMIFGTLPGWWLGEEIDRQDGPLLTEAGWDSILRKTGFSGLDGSLDPLPGGVDCSRQMVSTAIDDHLTDYPPASVLFCREAEPSMVKEVRDQLTKLSRMESPSCNILGAEFQDKFAIVLALEDSFWSVIDENGLNHVKSLMTTAHGILWVTRGARSQNPTANMMNGLARCIRKEIAGIRLVTLDLDGGEILPNERASEMILLVYRSLFDSKKASLVTDLEFWEIDGFIQIPRVFPNQLKDRYVERETRPPVPEIQLFHQEGRPLKLKLGQAGLLDTIHFVDDESQHSPLNADSVELSVRATGVNFKDVMIGLGQLPLYHQLGLECSGVVTAVGSNVTKFAVGDYVCGIAEGAYANNVRVSQFSIAKITPSMSFITAATIPVVYCTAYYALYEIGRLAKGDSILIHAAAGGVGQAAIMLAQRAKAEIFVTVGTTEKKNLMRQHYGIPDDHIFSSRDSSFQQELMHVTERRGVDLILNSIAGEILRQSWQCLAPLGRFIEIGKRDLVGNSNLEMRKFGEAVTFSAVDIGLLAEKRPYAFKKLLDEVMDLYQKGEIQTVTPISVFSISELQQAMRMMQSGKHMGKVVIEAKDGCVVQALPAPTAKIAEFKDASYLITGGTGGLGRSLVRWLAGQGAKHIITASRSGMKQKQVSELEKELHEMGVNLVVKQCDVGDRFQVQSLVADCQASLPPIKGVIHGAMALRDALFESISYEDWTLNIKPRVDGAWNLHHCLAETQLDFFLMLASMSGILGRPGQSAYAASNTFLDSFSTYRNELGLPTSVIDIGVVEGVGYVAEQKPEHLTTMDDRLTEAEVISLVKAHISRAEAFRSSEMAQTHTGLKLVANKPVPQSVLSPPFAHLLPQLDTKSSSQADGGRTMRDRLKQADTQDATIELICDSLRQNLSNLLMTPDEDIDLKKPIVSYGLDSLVAVELRNSISRNLEANVPLMELMNSPSIEHLAGNIAKKSKLVDQTIFSTQEDGIIEAATSGDA